MGETRLGGDANKLSWFGEFPILLFGEAVVEEDKGGGALEKKELMSTRRTPEVVCKRRQKMEGGGGGKSFLSQEGNHEEKGGEWEVEWGVAKLLFLFRWGGLTTRGEPEVGGEQDSGPESLERKGGETGNQC